MSQFKEGDVVMLKSGGPEMTICSMNDPKSYRCSWFDGNVLKEAYFNPASIELSE